MATARHRPQPQSQQPHQANLWEDRQSSFVPPRRMSQPPIRQFSSENTRELLQSQPPPTPDPPRNTNRSSSFFSFGRSHKSSQSVPTISSISQQSQQPNSQSRQSVDMSGGPQSGAYSQSSQSQPSQLQSQPQQQQPPPPPPHDPQAAPNGTGSRLSASGAPAPPPLHPELRSFVSLSFAHVHKIYFSVCCPRSCTRPTKLLTLMLP